MYRNLYLIETRLFVIFFASLGRSCKREKMPLFLGFNSVMSLPAASNKESLLLGWGGGFYHASIMDIMAVTIYRLEPLKALFIQPILADMGHLCRQFP